VKNEDEILSHLMSHPPPTPSLELLGVEGHQVETNALTEIKIELVYHEMHLKGKETELTRKDRIRIHSVQ
jgi:hypothetical protein